MVSETVIGAAIVLGLMVYLAYKFGSLGGWLSDPKNIIMLILLIVALGVALS